MASLLAPVTLRPAPVSALTYTCATTADDATADFYPTNPTAWSDGENTRIRVIRPSNPGVDGCPTKPAAGWPVVVYLHGWGGTRCESFSFASRSAIASWGYVVVSFNGRGMPAGYGLGGSGCDPATDAADALDDNGNDFAGPQDMRDIRGVINWVRDKYAPAGSGCSTTPPTNCADTENVAVTGHSYGGMRSWMMGVGPAANSEWDSRIKAVAPQAAGFTFDNVKNLSNDGNATSPVFRPRAVSAIPMTWSHPGWMGHLEKTAVPLALEGERARFVNETPSQTASDYWNARMLLNDDATIDKAADINVPILVMHGFLDGLGGVWTEPHVEAWNKIPRTDKYLYLGSCSHKDDPCHQTTNATRMRDTLRRFLDRHVKNDTTTYVRPPGSTNCAQAGPCVIYTVPPKWVSSTNNPWYVDGWQEESSSSWPATTTTETRYFRNDGTLATTPESGTGCSAPGAPPVRGTGCSTFENEHESNYPLNLSTCYGVRYGSTEVQSFTWPAFSQDKKLGRVEADLHVSSTTTRLQVYVDLFLVTGTTTEVETRIWQGNAQIVPVKRDGAVDTPYRFVFRPGGSAWTVAAGQKLRIKVASKLASAFAPEPLPATYTLHHNADRPSKVTLTYVQ
ncbi:MAG TPA: alpha/beta fold hydrolase [Acidimicrobiales bacterium]|nr:alpha/beta fold hydrolase [Acidimicrobiales bacterium]